MRSVEAMCGVVNLRRFGFWDVCGAGGEVALVGRIH